MAESERYESRSRAEGESMPPGRFWMRRGPQPAEDSALIRSRDDEAGMEWYGDGTEEVERGRVLIGWEDGEVIFQEEC